MNSYHAVYKVTCLLKLYFIGPPSPPENVSLSLTSSEKCYNISWSVSTTTGVNQAYIVVFDTFVVKATEPYVIFQQNTTNIQCNAYVKAVNGASESDPSKNVSIPSLPDVRAVTDSLTHQVWKCHGDIRVNISFQVRVHGFTSL